MGRRKKLDPALVAAAATVATNLRRGEVRLALAANRGRRRTAAAELAAARDELKELLERGIGALEITEMAATAGIQREQAHRILRGHGQPRLMDNELEEAR